MTIPFIENPELVMYVQVIIAMLLGSFIGLERSIAGKTAGMRTFGLVALASCLFVIIGIEVVGTHPLRTNFDLLRIVAGIISGIGFLGAGLIIFKEHTLRGLTTAAGLWVACGIGIAVGFGQIALAVFATFVTLFAFTVLWYVEEYVTTLHNDVLDTTHNDAE